MSYIAQMAREFYNYEQMFLQDRMKTSQDIVTIELQSRCSEQLTVTDNEFRIIEWDTY